MLSNTQKRKIGVKFATKYGQDYKAVNDFCKEQYVYSELALFHRLQREFL